MATNQEVEDFLEHFGVKGMRWGVRRRLENSQYFAPTTKEERQRIRRSKSAHEGRVILGKLGASVAAAVGSGYVARKLLSKKYDAVASGLGGIAAAHIGGSIAASILDLSGKRKAKEVQRKRDKQRSDAYDMYFLDRAEGKRPKDPTGGAFEKKYQKDKKEYEAYEKAMRQSKMELARYNKAHPFK